VVADTEYAHPAAWVIVIVWPPTVIVPARTLAVVFADTEYDTVPLPVPLAPAVIVIQLSLLVEVHAQPVVAVTLRLPLPALALRFGLVGATVMLHVPLWVTVTAWPAIVSVPVRVLVDVLAATSNSTVSVPLSLLAVSSMIQEALLVTVQLHPAGAVTVALNVVAPAAVLSEVGATV
jgi:hypothetical protein